VGEDGVTYYSGSRELMPYKICGYLLLVSNIAMLGVLIGFQKLLI